MRNTYLPFGFPSINEDEKREVMEVLESGGMAPGPRTNQFEKGMCDYLEVPYAIAVDSCAAALHLSLVALGIGEGDEVITTPLTSCSTANAILHQRATPVLADISSDTWNIDPEKVEASITHKTRAIIPAHFGGHPCEMDRFLDIAEVRGLALVEDAAHALGSHYKGAPIGKLSDATCFSFDTLGNLTTGEGGLIATHREEVDEKCRLLSHHGISKNTVTRYTSESSWYYQVIAPGFNYNMSDLQAAIGIHQLRKLEHFLVRRTEIAAQYNKAFESMDAIDLPEVKPYVRHAWNLFPILINADRLTIDRARFIEELHRRNVGSNVHFIPIHLHPFYRDLFGNQEGRYPISEWIYYREVSLPIYPRMTDRDVQDVVEAVADVLEKFLR
jgi:dTDP-4-amino-4,6-dideoxygalactose transaminase